MTRNKICEKNENKFLDKNKLCIFNYIFRTDVAEWSGVWVRFTVFNVTFNNISVISWRSVLLVEETGVHIENHWNATSPWQTLSHNVVSEWSRAIDIKTPKRLHIFAKQVSIQKKISQNQGQKNEGRWTAIKFSTFNFTKD